VENELRSLMQGRRFIYICGAEGSGTTLLLRLLTSPPHCSSLGGNYTKVPDAAGARDLAAEFVRANNAMWDPSFSFADHDRAVKGFAEVLARIMRSPCFAQQTHLFFKRSFPFGTEKGRFTPDLWDLHDVAPEVRFIAIHRDPRAACYSALRRNFDTDLRRLAVLASSNLTWLTAQLRQIDASRRRIVSYERLCENPMQTLAPLAEFCGLTPESLAPAVAAEKIDPSFNQRFQRELDPEMLRWLDQFFDARRRGQWEILEEATRAAFPSGH